MYREEASCRKMLIVQKEGSAYVQGGWQLVTMLSVPLLFS